MSSSRYVIWQAFCSLSHPHILVSIFGIAFWFFQQQFFIVFQHRPTLHLFQISAFVSSFLQWLLQQFLGLCHVLHSKIWSLCICYLTTNNFMLTFCTYEIWDTVFIQFILIFPLLYFSNFLLCSTKILQANPSSKFTNPSEKAVTIISFIHHNLALDNSIPLFMP